MKQVIWMLLAAALLAACAKRDAAPAASSSATPPAALSEDEASAPEPAPKLEAAPTALADKSSADRSSAEKPAAPAAGAAQATGVSKRSSAGAEVKERAIDGMVAPATPASPSFGAALSAFEDASRQLQLSLSNCGQACRALGSMERAAKQICELAKHDDEQQRCSEARARLEEARGRVKSACGLCPDGPSLDTTGR